MDFNDIRPIIIDLCIDFSHHRTDRSIIQILRQQWERRQFVALVHTIAVALKIPPTHLNIHWGIEIPGKKTFAWVEPGEVFGPHKLYYSESLTNISNFSFADMVFVTAHELCHIILHLYNHKYKESELATDILANVLGFDWAYAESRLTEVVGGVYLPNHYKREALEEIHKRVRVIYA